ncbi:hypothetical protein C8046_12100 [Serinibacter arcticus]|uniref:Uncharacterized protein n=1 Tax=Serinibacter arcticus TaxID=1655435 RepID=A0A2U1ZWE3_9MICO|nr:hypothetical protein [Serinibacter arcticus]PWD51291.1 hypothetical protein C8046_12100 [Serinibacter arcticus]
MSNDAPDRPAVSDRASRLSEALAWSDAPPAGEGPSTHPLWDSTSSAASDREAATWGQVLNAVVGSGLAAVVAAALVVLGVILGSGGEDAFSPVAVAVGAVVALVVLTLLTPLLLARSRADVRLRGHALAAIAGLVGVVVGLAAVTVVLVGGIALVDGIAGESGAAPYLYVAYSVLAVVIPAAAVPWAASRIYRRQYTRLT